jgi:monothiol glutaredoxin
MRAALIALVCLSSCFIVQSFAPVTRSIVRHASFLCMSDAGGLDDATREKLDNAVKNNKILLFMKGNKIFPQCGFSNTACRILDAVGQPFETINVLDDDRIRNGVKVYSSWPTIPQLYVDGEFIGGTDVMIEMYESGELAEMIEVACAS